MAWAVVEVVTLQVNHPPLPVPIRHSASKRNCQELDKPPNYWAATLTGPFSIAANVRSISSAFTSNSDNHLLPLLSRESQPSRFRRRLCRLRPRHGALPCKSSTPSHPGSLITMCYNTMSAQRSDCVAHLSRQCLCSHLHR